MSSIRSKNFLKKLGFKLAAVLITVALVFSLAGCDSKDKSTAEKSESESGTSESTSNYKFTELYNALLFEREEMSFNSEMSVELSDEAVELLNQYIFGSADADVDLDWINTTKISLYGNQDGNRSEGSIGLVLDDKEFANAYYMVDMDEGMIYFKLDGISDDVVGMSFEDVYGDMDIDYAEIQQMQEVIDEILPSPEIIDLLLERYINIAFEALETETLSETVEVEGISQELSVTKIPVSRKQLLNIILPVLETAKDDKEIKEIIENTVNTLIELGLVSEDEIGGDAYEILKEEVEALLEDADDAAAEVDDTELFALKLYTNDNDEICGIEAVTEGEVVFRWVDVQNGDDVATEISAPALFAFNGFTGLKGLGTVDGDTLDITYEVILNDVALCEIDVTDYDMAAAKNGYINANVRIAPTDDLYDFLEDEIGFDAAEYIGVLDPYIEFDISSDSGESAFSIAVGSHDADLVKISLTLEVSDSESIDSMTADYDFDEIEEWAESIDLDELEERLLNTEFGEFMSNIFMATEKSTEEATVYEDYYGFSY